ncbi:MAG: AlpA family phage regulatory protein [Magnetococcales bacterium]|nr:AlpA family phage regulatory protein [Magnetococcales bacterium]
MTAPIQYQLPETGFLRIRQIIGDPRANPPTPPIIPVKATTWWNGCKSGRFPKPVRLGPNSTGWRVEDIRKLVEDMSAGAAR